MVVVSTDDVAAQKAFAEGQKLTYPVLSDPDGSAATKYQVLSGRYASRVTFVVDPDGVIRHVDRSVNVSAHGAELAAVLQELRGR